MLLTMENASTQLYYSAASYSSAYQKLTRSCDITVLITIFVFVVSVLHDLDNLIPILPHHSAT